MRRHLGWKLFLSYLLVILTGVVTLGISAKFVVPTAFDRHMATMVSMMTQGSMGMMGGNMMNGTINAPEDLNADLFDNFRAAVNEALWRAGIAAFAVAVGISWFVSRQVVVPVRAMMQASQRIAEGHYDERVRVPGNPLEGDELTALALSFNRMAEKLSQTENMRRQLIADISHELRTPLTTIEGYMEGLMDGVLPPDVETFQDVHREAERLSRLVADLQELSRVEGDAYTLARAPTNLDPLVAAVTRRLTPQFEEKGVSLVCDIPEDLPPLSLDADRISQVLINLVGNALQYTPSGGKVSVTARLTDRHPRLPKGRWVLISVQDSGIGISPEHLPHLFDRFYRVDKSRSRVGGGSGIGLTIAKHLVEAHGGRIWAESEGTGQGSTFTFALPV